MESSFPSAAVATVAACYPSPPPFTRADLSSSPPTFPATSDLWQKCLPTSAGGCSARCAINREASGIIRERHSARKRLSSTIHYLADTLSSSLPPPTSPPNKRATNQGVKFCMSPLAQSPPTHPREAERAVTSAMAASDQRQRALERRVAQLATNSRRGWPNYLCAQQKVKVHDAERGRQQRRCGGQYTR